MTKRLAVARLWHEGNSFSPVPTTLAAFQQREWVSGPDALTFYSDTATEMGAVGAFAAAHPDWSVTWLRCAAASPGGPLENEGFAAMRDELLGGLARSPWDAVYLSLHGALITVSDPRPELTLLRAIRDLVGAVPIAVSLDLHANLGPELVALVDVAVGYKTYPHTDMRQTGEKALALLARRVAAEIRPAIALAKAGCVLTSFNMRTGDGPMAEIAAEAAKLARQPGILDATVFGGFAYGDSPDAGAAALVTADGDPSAAEEAARALAEAIRRRRHRFDTELPAPPAGLAHALRSPTGTVAVLDPADNPFSGGVADTTGLFRALIDQEPDVPTVFAFFWDPDTVAAAQQAGVGATLRCALGGRLTEMFGAPVAVTAEVLRLTEGRFRNIGPMESNLAVDLGRTAVLGVGQIRVIVTERCQTPNDPAYFQLHGIELAETRLLCVKAKNHFRAAFGPLCRVIIEVDAPGPAAPDLSRYSFRHVPRELLPKFG